MSFGRWIKLHEKLIDSEVFDNAFLLKVWVWCLLRAGYKSRTEVIARKKVEVPPGSFLINTRVDALTLKIGDTTLRRHLALLEELGNVAQKKTKKYTMVTVRNWYGYQMGGANLAQTWRKLGAQSATSANNDGHEISPYNGKKGKNRKNNDVRPEKSGKVVDNDERSTTRINQGMESTKEILTKRTL